jgi:L-alanine-DL-glutamate epimerase-like enolase superfamily enzyme
MELKDGKVVVPTGPGLGMILDTEALDRMTLHKTVVAA